MSSQDRLYSEKQPPNVWLKVYFIKSTVGLLESLGELSSIGGFVPQIALILRHRHSNTGFHDFYGKVRMAWKHLQLNAST